MNAVESSITSLVSDDHDVRKEAIKARFASGYQDPEELRGSENLGGWDQDALKENMLQYPDFHMVYCRAAYPTGDSMITPTPMSTSS
jgi:hypothetical protein